MDSSITKNKEYMLSAEENTKPIVLSEKTTEIPNLTKLLYEKEEELYYSSENAVKNEALKSNHSFINVHSLKNILIKMLRKGRKQAGLRLPVIKKIVNLYKTSGWFGIKYATSLLIRQKTVKLVNIYYLCKRYRRTPALLFKQWNVINESNSPHYNGKLILVSHDAHAYGAQHLILAIAKNLASEFKFQLDIVVLGEGPLMSDFMNLAPTHDLSGIDPNSDKAIALVETLKAKGHSTAIVNTTVSGLFLNTLKNAGIYCLALVHELPGSINAYGLYPAAQTLAAKADKVIFPATYVAEAFAQLIPLSEDKIIIRPQGLIRKNNLRNAKEKARKQLRKQLKIHENSRVVLAMGYGYPRKGTDLFIEIGLEVLKTHPDVHFVWVGPLTPIMQAAIKKRLAKESLSHQFIFTGYIKNTDPYFAGADVFALTSREDPFPSVLLQSLEVSVPVVAFQDVGGFTPLLKKGTGVLIPKENIFLFSNAITNLLDNPHKSKELGDAGSDLIKKDFSFNHYVFDLLKLCHVQIKKVSAIVPNYNYARYLEERLTSIFDQTYPLFEIIILDDASTDNSMEVIDHILLRTNIECKVIKNDKNSGSVFSQWKKGIELAQGDYIWICEADDFSHPAFLENVLLAFEDKEVTLSYSESRRVNEHSAVIANDYLDYTYDINPEKWTQDYISEGKEELREALSIKNTVPNVSAAVFPKVALKKALEKCESELSHLKVAGDWLVYAELMNLGKIAFTAKSLNSHRKHKNNVSVSTADIQHMADIVFMQNRIAKMVALNEAADQKAKEYMNKIKVHFGFSPEDEIVSQKINQAVQKLHAASEKVLVEEL